MKTKLIVTALFILMLSLTGCATFETIRHEYTMRGQILDSSDEGIYLCIGSADGAKTGQEYKVFKFEKIQGNKSIRPNFKKKETGAVIITEIIDEHYAKAKLVTGEAKENYIVELDSK